MSITEFLRKTRLESVQQSEECQRLLRELAQRAEKHETDLENYRDRKIVEIDGALKRLERIDELEKEIQLIRGEILQLPEVVELDRSIDKAREEGQVDRQVKTKALTELIMISEETIAALEKFADEGATPESPAEDKPPA